MAETSDILIRLLERTNQDKVNWKPTSDEQTFIAVLGKASVMILRDDLNDTVLRILNPDGREIETLDTATPAARQWVGQLRELYTKARRIALGVDSQLDELLRELETDP